MPKSYTVEDDYNGSRLDKWFKNKIINLPHSLLEKLLRQNKVKVNKKKTKSSYRLQTGDLVEIYNISKFKPSIVKEISISHLDKFLFDISYDYVGDMAETVSLIWPDKITKEKNFLNASLTKVIYDLKNITKQEKCSKIG